MIHRPLILKLIYAFIAITILLSSSLTAYAIEDYVWSISPDALETASPDDSSDAASSNSSTPESTSSENSNSNATTTQSNFLNLESGAAILIDQNSGQVLYEHNSHEQLRPASVTKIMSLLLIMEALDSNQIKLDDKVPCSEKASSMGGSQVWLTTSESFSVDEMLKCICVVSANDCTVAMAEYLCGSTDAFVEKMNTRAKELGMNDTCFKNCHGIDEDGHVTSSYDIAIMSRELLQNHPTITNYTTIWMDSIRDGKSQLVSTNKLVRNYEGCTGLKTGSTSLALYNLSASATRNDLNLIAVIMKAPTTALRFSEAKKLLDYGFSSYESCKLSSSMDVVKTVTINQGVESTINAVCSDTKNALIKKGQESRIVQEVNIPDNISAPISQGEKIGEINYFLDGTQIGSVDIVSDKTIRKISFINISSHLLKRWFSLLRF
ncbi:MAG: D-alanyl-D-alanine carboxypeptidase [Clostridia bacterium]|nr:D-alanyl-D-alanine carboxypeptidase [Clostridia bacterium]